MGINLQLLGITAIPRLANEYDIRIDFPRYSDLFKMAPEDFQKVVKDTGGILTMFRKEFKATWTDVYHLSDIGMERVALAQEMQLQPDDTVLDVGCGRGYFTIAAARISKHVAGLDLMDGYGRVGWWQNHRISMREMKLSDKVAGVRADAQSIPFRESSFDVAASVHSVRNFENKGSIERAIAEMKRVVSKGGHVMVAETLPDARNKAQEAHLQMFKCKAKYTLGELDYLQKEEFVRMFQKVGFRDIEVKELDYNLSAAPPLFCIDYNLSRLGEDEKAEAKKSYEKAVSMIEKHGEASPPTALVSATK